MKGAKANVALVGLGKMGISHLAIANASKRINVVAVCDSSALLGHMVEKHCGIPYAPDYAQLITRPDLQGVVIATPTRVHEPMIRAALERGLNVFCEKPMTLSSSVSQDLAREARSRGLVGQVGYHNRFVGTFAEMNRLIRSGAIGRLRHIHAEAYGPVVLKPVGKTWRSEAGQGGGCLYDYAAHPINLMNWFSGAPVECPGAELTHQYSTDVEDGVYANLRMADGVTGQVTVNWSDETMRKMNTQLSAWGDGGKIVADRQELKVFIGANGEPLADYGKGWTVRYITELTPPVDYYLRGEEYSSQMETFADAILRKDVEEINNFDSAAETDLTLEMIRARAAAAPVAPAALGAAPAVKSRSILARMMGR